MELVDTRFKLLCDEFTLKSQIGQNDENISFGYRNDMIFRFASVSALNIVHVVSNNTPRVAVTLKVLVERLSLTLRGLTSNGKRQR